MIAETLYLCFLVGIGVIPVACLIYALCTHNTPTQKETPHDHHQ